MPAFEIHWTVSGTTRLTAKDADDAQKRFERLSVGQLVDGISRNVGVSKYEFTQTDPPTEPGETPAFEAHRLVCDDTDDPDVKEGASLAIVHAASRESVALVLGQSEHGRDGRSPWVWLRLRNGDLLLGVFPRGDTYLAVENDAAGPSGI